VLDILKMKYVNQHMRQFVEREGQNSDDLKLHLRRDIQPDVVNKMLAKDEHELTAVERQRIKKEQRHIEEFELMKKAAAAAKLNSSINRQLVQQQFHGRSALGSQKFGDDTMAGTKPFLGTVGRIDNNLGTMSSEGFDANNRTMEASSRDSTIRQASQMMPQNPHTEYDKPWYPAKKDYLKDTKEITISFDRDNDDDNELPS
jgi:hypothetical protein